MKKSFLLRFTFLFFLTPLIGQNQDQKFLKLTQSDFYVLPAEDNGYHLYVRKKYGIESVMLVESNKDPAGKKTNYAYRALEYNPINGDEVRLLDGKVLNSKYAKYSLIDSSVEKNPVYGQAFHIYIPKKIVYGYPWSRNGSVELNQESFFVNIRSFGKKFADYSGGFLDNSFTISLKKEKLTLPQVKEPAVSESSTFAYEDDDEDLPFVTLNSSSDLEITLTPYQSGDEENSLLPEENLSPEEETSSWNENSLSDTYNSDSYEKSFDYTYDDTESEDYLYIGTDDRDSKAYQAVKIIDNTDLDPPSSSLFDEDKAKYNPAYGSKSSKSILDLPLDAETSIPQDPYQESMKGVDQVAMEALINSVPQSKNAGKTAQNKKAENPSDDKINPFGEDYYIGYDGIKFIYGKGKGKIPDLYVSETEVSQACYERIMGSNPSANVGPDFPVDSISFYDAIYFCNKLSLREGRTPCYALKGETDIKKWGSVPKTRSSVWSDITCNFDADGYRLLTVDEWVFFANGGVNRQSGNYAGSRDIKYVAWFLDNSGEISAKCGQKEKNPCGLYDMCGNLSEFVYGPSGDKEKTTALKGGNYLSNAKSCQTKFTIASNPWLAEPTNGLRICRKIEKK